MRDYRERLRRPRRSWPQLRALDPLTGAGTYSQLKASLDAELARSRRYGRPAAALLFGFDDYPGLRYELGRDEVRPASSRTWPRRSAASCAARTGSFRMDVDEFVVLLPETDLAGARMRRGAAGGPRRATSTRKGPTGPCAAPLRVAGAVFPHAHVHSGEDLLREANRSFLAQRERQRVLSAPARARNEDALPSPEPREREGVRCLQGPEAAGPWAPASADDAERNVQVAWIEGLARGAAARRRLAHAEFSWRCRRSCPGSGPARSGLYFGSSSQGAPPFGSVTASTQYR